jgi:hypothetical protein
VVRMPSARHCGRFVLGAPLARTRRTLARVGARSGAIYPCFRLSDVKDLCTLAAIRENIDVSSFPPNRRVRACGAVGMVSCCEH